MASLLASSRMILASPVSTSRVLDVEQPRRVAAEDGGALPESKRRGGHHVVDRMLLPRNRVIGAEYDLTRAHLRHQMPKRFFGEDQRVEIHLVEICRRLFLEDDVRIAIDRRHEAGVIGTWRVGTEIAASMRCENLEAREFVQRPFEDEMLQRDGGVQRIADGVRQPSVAL